MAMSETTGAPLSPRVRRADAATPTSQRDTLELPRSNPQPQAAPTKRHSDPVQLHSLALEDGPLYRATLVSLERRANSLRAALKKLVRALETSLAALQADAYAQATLDEVLEDLSAGSFTSESEALKGLYARDLCAARMAARGALQRETDRAREISDRTKGAIDRLKGVEERRKAFEADAKRYYDELAKYLARSDPDPVKLAQLDAKQAERAGAFRRARIEYFAFLEGLVDGEERAVAEWLRNWATPPVEHEISVPVLTTESADLHVSPVTVATRSHSPTMNDLPAYIVDAVSAPASASSRVDVPGSDDGRSSAPATSIHSSLSRVTTGGETGVSSSGATSPPPEDSKRRRRTSLPHFGFGSPPISKEGRDEKDAQEGGARDRLKGFFRSAHQSITAALPSSPSVSTLAASSLLQPPLSPTLLQSAGGPSTSSSNAASVRSLEPDLTSLRPSASRSDSSSRRKEGFLYATETSQRHTQSGDGGARYQRFWVVLEDHLTEYDKWTDAMSVHGSPINLRYATARISQQAGDRRFAFEVLTPEWRRVYQASSDAECREWVEAIQARVESLLNGTSSVRYFDSSHLQSAGLPNALGDFGSSAASGATSPKSRLPDFLFRRASAGHSRKMSREQLKREKRRSHQIPIPAVTIGEEGSNFAIFDNSRRREMFAHSEGDVDGAAAKPALNGLGLPFDARLVPAAAKSSPDLTSLEDPRVPKLGQNQRSASAGHDISNGAPYEGVSEDETELSQHDRAIYDAVRTWVKPGDADAAPPALDRSDKHSMAKRIRELASQPGNDRCADCGAPAPKWASWNLGITVCIRCSGVHRSLGTHISKVKSIDLDDWTEEQVLSMERIGNMRSNAEYEAALPADAHSALTDATIGAFIRQKYVEGQFRK